MPVLDLDHPEPFVMTLGTMLYPGLDDGDRSKAKAFASQNLVVPIREAMSAGHNVSDAVRARLHDDSGAILDDLQERWNGGLWTGDIFKMHYTLAQSHRQFASLENAIAVAERVATQLGLPGVRSSSYSYRKQFITVGHLWAAWSIRDGKFTPRPEVGYDAFADFQAFLTEAEILRDWAQNWPVTGSRMRTPPPPDVWRVPDNWRPPECQPGWPKIGIPPLSLESDLLAGLKTAARSRPVR